MVNDHIDHHVEWQQVGMIAFKESDDSGLILTGECGGLFIYGQKIKPAASQAVLRIQRKWEKLGRPYWEQWNSNEWFP